MTTTRNNQRSTFARARAGNPGGCYTCEACGRRTRHTDTNSGTSYCSDCFAAMEAENGVADEAITPTPPPTQETTMTTVSPPAALPRWTTIRIAESTREMLDEVRHHLEADGKRRTLDETIADALTQFASAAQRRKERK